MRLLQVVWNGPFKTPPLQQPITVGWVLLKLLETVWRLLLIAFLLVAGVAAYAFTTYQKPLTSQVRVQLSQSGAYCSSKGWPIGVRIINDSRATLGEVSIAFRVYPQGQSEDVTNPAGSGKYEELHQIITAGNALDWCFKMPDLNPGSTGPYTITADVTDAEELSSDVPVTSAPTSSAGADH